jgi:hypothetical protein
MGIVHADLVPVLLGDGARLFEALGPNPLAFEVEDAEADCVVHLQLRVATRGRE